jgi:hypothetical protein
MGRYFDIHRRRSSLICNPRRLSFVDLKQSERSMNSVQRMTLFGGVVILLLWACGKPQEAAKASGRSSIPTSVKLPPMFNEGAGKDSLARRSHFGQYHNATYGFDLSFDSSQARINTVSYDVKNFNFWTGEDRIAQANVIERGDLGDYFHFDSSGLANLQETTLLPDTPFAAAMLDMLHDCSEDNSDDGLDMPSTRVSRDPNDGLELPPTRVTRDVNSHGVRFVKLWCNYIVHEYNKPTEHFPAGPFYLVDLSTSTRAVFLKIILNCERAAPKDAETFVDSFVNSIEIVRQ